MNKDKQAEIKARKLKRRVEKSRAIALAAKKKHEKRMEKRTVRWARKRMDNTGEWSKDKFISTVSSIAQGPDTFAAIKRIAEICEMNTSAGIVEREPADQDYIKETLKIGEEMSIEDRGKLTKNLYDAYSNSCV